jgi:hypothetical protein
MGAVGEGGRLPDWMGSASLGQVGRALSWKLIYIYISRIVYISLIFLDIYYFNKVTNNCV